MGMLRSKCCGGFGIAEPASACTAVDNIPPHPSAPSTRHYVTGTPLATTLLTAGVTAASATLGDSTAGRHPLRLTATPTQAAWSMLLIVWFDFTNLDPRQVGSLTGLGVGTYLKASTETLHAVPIAAGVAIEQAGQTYLALTQRWPVPTPTNPCCWIYAGASAGDNLACEVPTHYATSDNRTSPTEVVLSGGPVLSSDRFGVFNNTDGSINTDQRPNFDLGQTPHPVTRFGYVIGLTSHPLNGPPPVDFTAEPHTLKAITAPICGTISSPGMAAYTATSFNPPGSLLVNEPLDAGLPAGWESIANVWVDDLTASPEGGGPGGLFTARDGFTLVETQRVSDQEYCAGIAWTTINVPPAPYSDNFALTVEFTWRRINEQDRRYDPATGWLAPDIRSQSCGVWIGGLGRALLSHYITSAIVGGVPSLSGASSAQIQHPVHNWGGFAPNGQHYPATPYGWPCPCPLPYPDLPSCNPATGSVGQNVTITNFLGCANASPENGDRVTFQVRRRLNDPAIGCLDPGWANHRYDFRLWINGRHVPFDFADFGWVWIPTPPLRVGLMAYWGGGWSDFKVWFNP